MPSARPPRKAASELERAAVSLPNLKAYGVDSTRTVSRPWAVGYILVVERRDPYVPHHH
jgi:hypothetical protein